MIYIDSNIKLSSKKFGYKNTLRIGTITYSVASLSEKHKKSKGGNSSVFKLLNPNNNQEFAIKFLKFPFNSTTKNHIKQNIRFTNEIAALKEAKSKGFENVVDFVAEGIKKIGKFEFQYYVMEKAKDDLNNYLKNNILPPNQKLLLSFEITKGLMQLHSMDLYHRDIKPDNIFIVEKNGKDSWKIGDLGLSAKRDQDLSEIEFQEKIGPYGWLSPEVTNKFLCEGSKLESVFDCKIDMKSDIFQLGKLLWYIFQGNIPVGQIIYSDFLIQNEEVFNLIFSMLSYDKKRREELAYYQEKFQNLSN